MAEEVTETYAASTTRKNIWFMTSVFLERSRPLPEIRSWRCSWKWLPTCFISAGARQSTAHAISRNPYNASEDLSCDADAAWAAMSEHLIWQSLHFYQKKCLRPWPMSRSTQPRVVRSLRRVNWSYHLLLSAFSFLTKSQLGHGFGAESQGELARQVSSLCSIESHP